MMGFPSTKEKYNIVANMISDLTTYIVEPKARLAGCYQTRIPYDIAIHLAPALLGEIERFIEKAEILNQSNDRGSK